MYHYAVLLISAAQISKDNVLYSKFKACCWRLTEILTSDLISAYTSVEDDTCPLNSWLVIGY